MTTAPHRPLRAPAHTLADVLAATCSMLGVTRDDLVGNGRHADVVAAREVFALVARRTTFASYPEIARLMGRTSHAGVHEIHARAIRRMDKATAWGPTRAALAGAVEAELAGEIEREMGEKGE